jgi:phage-related protein
VPNIRVVFFKERNGNVPVLEWLDLLPVMVQDKLTDRIRRLTELGHGLRRPEADFLRDGIYELRVRRQRVNYRILYFFHGREIAVLGHGIVKKGVVPNADIERALERKVRFERNPSGHTYEEAEL